MKLPMILKVILNEKATQNPLLAHTEHSAYLTFQASVAECRVLGGSMLFTTIRMVPWMINRIKMITSLGYFPKQPLTASPMNIKNKKRNKRFYDQKIRIRFSESK